MSDTWFGEHWIHVRGKTYVILDEWLMELLCGWYAKKHKDEELEYLIKAFFVLKPRYRDEALRYLTILEDAFEKTNCKEIIDRIFEKS